MPARELTGYALSLPERALRSMTALAGGLLREMGDVAIPAALRRTRLFRTLVESTLRFLIEEVGQVEGTYPDQDKLAEDFLKRRAAGNGLELIGIVAFRASPVWVMAALADLSGTGRHLVSQIAGSLKREGLLDPGRNFETVDQMLDGLEATAGRLAESINTPPLDVAGLRQEWQEIRTLAARIPPRDRPPIAAVEAQWAEIEAAAAQQGRSPFEVSALLAVSAVRQLPANVLWLSRCAGHAVKHTGELLAASLLGHYQEAVAEVRTTGFARYWAREFRPYLHAAARQFSPRRKTLTERFLAR